MTGTGKKIKNINKVGNPLIDSLFSGEAWGGNTITYAFPGSKSAYSYSGEKGNNFGAVSGLQKKAAMFAMDTAFGSKANDGFSVEGFTGVKFAKGGAGNATIRFAESDAASPTAYAYYPSTSAKGGDIWFSTNYKGTTNDYRDPKAGNYAWHTLLHELGHALGLKHGHERESGFPSLPRSKDSVEFTVMTYTTFVGDNGGGYQYEQFGAPQTFMMFDIAALQRMYGADFSTNKGSTTYSWKPGTGDTFVNGKVGVDAGANRIFATIWDGGGKDTYDLSAYKNDVTIDLRPGKHSVFKDSQLAFLGGGPNGGDARGNIFNALLYKNNERSLIENARGGSGDDVIIGNEAKNKLVGRGGNDRLDGGRDKNADTLNGGAGADDFVFKKGYGRDTVQDFRNGVDDLDLRSFNVNANQVLNKAVKVGADVHIKMGDGDVLVLKKFAFNDLDGSDFLL
jgi:serralysin